MSIRGKLSIIDLQNRKLIKGSRVFIRVDFNVPLDKDFNVTNNQRIVGALPTIKYALDHGASKVILASHLGRPNGKVQQEYSLKHVLKELEKLLNVDVVFCNDCVGQEVEAKVNSSSDGSVILLENLRFHIEEEGCSKDSDGKTKRADAASVATFRKGLSKLADVYVNDAFGTAHRAHSSMVNFEGMPRACGFLMMKELEYFAKVLEDPNRPFLAILGGAKVSDKIQLIDNLLDKVDEIIICGGMAFTFLKIMKDMKIGDSIYDIEGAKKVNQLVEKAQNLNKRLVFPIDFVIADKFDADANTDYATVESGIPDHWQGLSCGPESLKIFKKIIESAKTILWNGPPGVFEFPKFAKATNEIIKYVSESYKNGNVVIVGGGDSATCIAKAGMENSVSHVSTGGGASLELLEGKVLPGVDALSTKT